MLPDLISNCVPQVYICHLEIGNSIVIATNAPDLAKNEIFLKAELIQDFHSLEFSLIEMSLQLKKVAPWPEGVKSWETLPIFTDAEIPAGYLE
ncbi:hypothetical protein AVDCRST_MAG84-4913 [uncultured Microcoleus sp.]|uniref:Uncharacterized protein n=1 Tax=uncultured Microcoleus sp. TaxID=259945 RepID=A0A6J4N6A1_9CYAN|nr:hypothetical protein AVDCRST_MAG84-4913 [uncultured Microcoleus sp.]